MEIDMKVFQKIGIKIDTSLETLTNSFCRPASFKYKPYISEAADRWFEKNGSNKEYLEALDINKQKANNLLSEFEKCLKETK
jgi:hypothetical protein|tara:strand:- start:3614 stop:3859 length:246 start_codon:yes stop_codon:yes gene_type:complete